MEFKDNIKYSFFDMQVGRQVCSYLKTFYSWQSGGIELRSRAGSEIRYHYRYLVGTVYPDGQICMDFGEDPTQYMTKRMYGMLLREIHRYYNARWITNDKLVGRRKPVSHVNTGVYNAYTGIDFGESLVNKFGRLANV